jgi:CheY-like chemotaxis protein
MTAATARPRALVVEDEKAIRELVRLHLDLAGFQIDEAADGVTVCRAIRSERSRDDRSAPKPHPPFEWSSRMRCRSTTRNARQRYEASRWT